MKELSEMTLEELWQLFPISLAPYSPRFAIQAQEEIDLLGEILKDFNPRFHHIGSTAIPGIYAKPIVDILAEIPPCFSRNQIRTRLEKEGYICMSESVDRLSFNKGYTKNGFAGKVFHIHVRLPGDCDEIYFRDYLNAHPEMAHEYETLKMSLLPKYRHDRDGYTEAKTQFISELTARAKREAAIGR